MIRKCLSGQIVFAVLCSIVLIPAAVFADWGEEFLFVKCNPGEVIFEVQPLIIWNEELEALLPAVERAEGIIEKDHYQLFRIRSHSEISASCTLDDIEIKVSFSRYIRGNLELFENGQLISSPPIGGVLSSYGYVFKARYTKSNGWEEYCGGEKSLIAWKALDRNRTKTDCAQLPSPKQTANKIKKEPSVAQILLEDGSLRLPPMIYKTLATKGEVCDTALNHLNHRYMGQTSDLKDLSTLRNGTGTLTLPEHVFGKHVRPSIFDFNNDGIQDTVFSYQGTGSYLSGILFYVGFGYKNKSLTASDIVVFPCQFDASASSSYECPSISQKSDDAGIQVAFENGRHMFFRGRYTGMVPFRHDNRTYIILKSYSHDTELYAAVIYPYEKTKYDSICLFKRQP